MKLSKIIALICSSLMLSLNIGCSSSSEQNNNVQTAVENETSAAAETVTETETEAATEAETETESETEAETTTEVNPDEIDFSQFSTFELSSEDLHDGAWDPDIANSGSNRSPQLKWEAVEGAGLYYICMIDTTAGNWLHWKSISEGETELPAGWAPSQEYVGPYPPPGSTHDYEIYVFALKEPLERIKGAFDNSNPKMFEFMKSLDGEGGNIISYGHITGTFTKEET